MLQKHCLTGRDDAMLVNHSVQSVFGCGLHGHDLCVNRMSLVAVTMVMLFFTPKPCATRSYCFACRAHPLSVGLRNRHWVPELSNQQSDLGNYKARKTCSTSQLRQCKGALMSGDGLRIERAAFEQWARLEA